MTFAAITTSTTGLLIISLQRFGNIIVNHITHIGLVDTHTKGNRGNNHIDSLHQEIILIIGSGLGVHTCVICQRLDAISQKQLGQLLNLLTAQTVYDSALASTLLDESNNIVFGIMFGANLIEEI